MCCKKFDCGCIAFFKYLFIELPCQIICGIWAIFAFLFEKKVVQYFIAGLMWAGYSVAVSGFVTDDVGTQLYYSLKMMGILATLMSCFNVSTIKLFPKDVD